MKPNIRKVDIRKISKINYLICSGRSGEPKTMAEKLAISERMLYHFLSFMKTELNAPIKYDKSKKRYFYSRAGKLGLTWEDEIIK
jgi:hypothetical protein